MVTILQIAPNGRYQSGQLSGEHSMPNPVDLPWNGPTNDNRGFVRPVNSGLCEDNQRYDLLQMHPKWVTKGSIKGYLPAVTLPAHAIFKARVGFLKGASGTDGVQFQVWVHFSNSGQNIGYRVFNMHKKYDGKMTEVSVDISHLSGKQVRLELRVDAGNSSGQDWAVWADPKVDTRNTGTDGRVFRLRPLRFRILNRNEESWVNGRGDEPYFGAIYFRSIFGKPGSTKVESFTTLKTQGDDLGTGTYEFQPNSNLEVSDVATIWNDSVAALGQGLQISGYLMAAIEEDWHGKGAARDILLGYETKLFKALVEHVENNLAGALNTEQTAADIKNDVFGSSSGFLKEKLIDALKFVTNADDSIGDNSITLINLTPAELQEKLGADYNPGSLNNPIGPIDPRVFQIDFKGSDAHYRVDVALTFGNWSDRIVN